jgi:hypothetical protein
MVSGTCSVCGENRELRAGMCVPHYSAAWREKMSTVKCKVEGCELGVKSRMMCNPHYSKVRRSERSAETLKKKRELEYSQQVIENIKWEERKRVIHALRIKVCKDCQSERSIHPKCYGLKEAISALMNLEVKNVYE